ncbi:MAG: HAD family hydrolase [Clostridiales bacterium]|nr:HAD family hydrolase [Clostridiales bacterium]
MLFDLDGTLTDPKEGITRCVQYALQSFGIEVKSLDELICFIGPPLRESFQNFYGMSEADAEKAVEKYRERFSAVGKFENSVLPGIIPMLKKLKEAGKIMALSTSKPWVFAEQILKKYELDSYFSVVVGSELDGTRDEKQEVILETLKRFGLEKGSKEAVMIGDRRHDILGAKKCGLDGIGVRFGYAEEGELEKAGAVMIADTVEELQRMLLSSDII